MKKLFTLFAIVTVAIGLFAQVPQKMSYQCIIRNTSGDLIINQEVGIRISILQGTETGTVVYQETFTPNPQTNENGLLSIEIGNGTPVTGIFSSINWSTGLYFLKTETDPTGGTNYTISGVSQMLSVPFALYSKTAETAADKTYVDALKSQIDELKVISGHWIKDIDGNIYKIEQIGTQTWMIENLKTTKYNNGDAIPNVTGNIEWKGLTTGAYCWVNSDINKKDLYGAMYNFYAVIDSRNICPSGWHAATDSDFKILEMHLGMSQAQADAEGDRGTDQGTQMKSTTGWNEGENGTNTSGFSVLPSGSRYNNDGLFYAQLVNAHFWMATESSSNTAWDRIIFNNKGVINRVPSANKANGMVVRCIRNF